LNCFVGIASSLKHLYLKNEKLQIITIFNEKKNKEIINIFALDYKWKLKEIEKVDFQIKECKSLREHQMKQLE